MKADNSDSLLFQHNVHRKGTFELFLASLSQMIDYWELKGQEQLHQFLCVEDRMGLNWKFSERNDRLR